MNILYPSYMEKFKCTADKCKHNCCIGWEIDIDDQTFNRYKELDENGTYKILNTIETTEGIHHFVLNGDRCPHLNKSNLCNIILNCGEENLCQICSDHPRFINEYETHDEVGLGFCCEAAVDLILKSDAMNLPKPNDVSIYEKPIFLEREYLGEVLKDKKISLKEKLLILDKHFQVDIIDISFDELREFLLKLEILDESWPKYLIASKEKDIVDGKTINKENYLLNFFYRHAKTCLCEYDLSLCYLASKVSLQLIENIASDEMDFLDKVRMFSSEIEYSEENTYSFFDFLQNKLENS